MNRRVLIAKQARTLELILDGSLERRYPIALGRNASADKSVEGDDATPLGEFYICAKNPRSRYFLSLCLSYPNAEDAQRGLASGLIGAQEYRQILAALHAGKMPPQHTRLGGEIYIHGRAVKEAGGDPPEKTGPEVASPWKIQQCGIFTTSSTSVPRSGSKHSAVST